MEQRPNRDRAALRRREAKRARRQQGLWLTALLFGVILIFDLCLLFGTDRTFSDSENRMLAQKPDFSLSALADGSWFRQYGDYLADQFAGRDFWLSSKLGLERFFGRDESSGVYLCDDDYLIQKPSEPDVAALQRNLSAINDFSLRYKDLDMYMTTVPNAACILADKLPSNAPVRDQRADIAGIAAPLQHVRFLDVTEALEAHKDEQLYYRTDHHWTSLAAYYAFESMAPQMGISAPIQIYDVYPVTDSFEGTLSSKSGSHAARDAIYVYAPKTDVAYNVTYTDSDKTVSSLYDRSCLEAKDQYTVFFGGNHPRIDVRTTSASGKRLLVFKDSYANCFIQFLVPYYEKIVIVDPRYYYDSTDKLIKQEQITDVLFLYNTDTFLTDNSLADVLAADE